MRKEKPLAENTQPVVLRDASPGDMPFIMEHLEKFLLDDEDIDFRQFIVAVENREIVGFGRIRPHREVYELGSIGVVENRRSKGVGTVIVRRLIDIFPTDDVYLVTDIPGYFEKLGFQVIPEAPEELLEKIRRICPAKCRGTAVAMHLRRPKKT
jgi:N-acetylglutamate synthase-like GNAT family acetyltransferase